MFSTYLFALESGYAIELNSNRGGKVNIILTLPLLLPLSKLNLQYYIDWEVRRKNALRRLYVLSKAKPFPPLKVGEGGKTGPTNGLIYIPR